ncbi:Nse1 non-SMC component of SMC5-6 complex-domain-containing protein [Sporodiniella umbellata]|nr:Nse1 non-SMC component of SMC5-6 complex-domain-containing protein [Sporodiniella umbellata]
MSEHYNDSHRLFVQAMLSKRFLPEEEAESIYLKVCDVVESEPVDFAIFISQINKSLEDLDYSLRRSKNERTGTEHLSLVNIKQDKIVELASNYSPVELKFCRSLIDAIVNADHENYAVTTSAALRLGGPLKLSHKETQDVLDRLVEDGWIAEENKGVYFLDTRGLAELQSYLRDQYGDAIKECTICLDVVTMGEYCQLGNCPVRLHKYCADSQFRGAQNPVCPQCSTAWMRMNRFGLGLE